MSYVVINAITVPGERSEELERRFSRRAGEVGRQEGFERFELLRPDNDAAAGRYLVYTRWASKDAFEAWMSSSAFGRGHRSESSEGPVGTGSEVWAYEVAQDEDAAP